MLPTQEEAEREVERLNGVAQERRSTDVRYFLQPTRFFPDGRGISA